MDIETDLIQFNSEYDYLDVSILLRGKLSEIQRLKVLWLNEKLCIFYQDYIPIIKKYEECFYGNDVFMIKVAKLSYDIKFGRFIRSILRITQELYNSFKQKYKKEFCLKLIDIVKKYEYYDMVVPKK